jgi:hypothetical protein
MEIQTQMKKVLEFIYLLFLRLIYRFGYNKVFYLERSSSKMMDATGKDV